MDQNKTRPSDAAHGQEIEVKLSVAPGDIGRVRSAIEDEAGGPLAWHLRELDARYFDDSDWSLARDGSALRIRHEGARWIQTFKHALGRWPLNIERSEHSWTLEGPLLDVAILDEDPHAHLIGAARMPLVPCFSTRIQRELAHIDLDGARIEVCIDRGVVTGCGRSEEICEVELELIHGPSAVLYALGARLLASQPVRLGRGSKAASGYRLCGLDEDHLIDDARSRHPPRLAERIAIRGAQTLATLADFGDTLTTTAETVHDARVLVRRLRAHDQVAHAVAGHDESTDDLPSARLATRWFMEWLGTARDADVYAYDSLPACLARMGRPEPELLGRAKEESDQFRRLAEQTLRGGMFQAMLLALAARQARARSVMLATSDEALRKALVARFAAWDRKLLRAGRHPAALGQDEWHRIRIMAKRMRYGLDVTEALWPPGHMDAYRRAVVRLQGALGDHRDALLAVNRLTQELGPLSRSEQSALTALVGARQGHAIEAWQGLVAVADRPVS